MKILLRLAGRYLLEVLSLAMLVSALFFFVKAEEMKRKLKEGNPEMFQSGDNVTVLKAIDGDEILVRNDSGYQVVVRILGIKSFSPTISDPKLSEYGNIAFNYLRTQLEGKRVTLELNGLKVDSKKRLLSYIYLGDKAEEREDVGKRMVELGITLVYVRYDFSKINEYIEAEQSAERDLTGLWSNETVNRRASSLRRIWLEEKLQDD